MELLTKKKTSKKDFGNQYPVGTRYFGDIAFLLDFHRDVDRLRSDSGATSLYDISFQCHNDVVAIT